MFPIVISSKDLIGCTNYTFHKIWLHRGNTNTPPRAGGKKHNEQCSIKDACLTWLVQLSSNDIVRQKPGARCNCLVSAWNKLSTEKGLQPERKAPLEYSETWSTHTCLSIRKWILPGTKYLKDTFWKTAFSACVALVIHVPPLPILACTKQHAIIVLPPYYYSLADRSDRAHLRRIILSWLFVFWLCRVFCWPWTSQKRSDCEVSREPVLTSGWRLASCFWSVDPNCTRQSNFDMVRLWWFCAWPLALACLGVLLGVWWTTLVSRVQFAMDRTNGYCGYSNSCC